MAVPKVKDGKLDDAKIQVGSPSWFQWLNQNKSFRFESDIGTFTASRSGKGHYWYAYRKSHGKLYSEYIGTSKEVNLNRCLTIAKLIDDQIKQKNPPLEKQVEHLTTRVKNLETEIQELKRTIKTA